MPILPGVPVAEERLSNAQVLTLATIVHKYLSQDYRQFTWKITKHPSFAVGYLIFADPVPSMDGSIQIFIREDKPRQFLWQVSNSKREIFQHWPPAVTSGETFQIKEPITPRLLGDIAKIIYKDIQKKLAAIP